MPVVFRFNGLRHYCRVCLQWENLDEDTCIAGLSPDMQRQGI